MDKFLPNTETNEIDKIVNNTKLLVNADTPSVKKANFVARIFLETHRVINFSAASLAPAA